MSTMPPVVMWEISGVLADDRVVFDAAVADALGTEVPTATAGAPPGTDCEIIDDASRQLGRKPMAGDTERVSRAFEARRAEVVDRGRARGSAELLSQLKQRDAATMFIPLTGRTKANAALVLAATGLDRYFDTALGAYGSCVSARAHLFDAARQALVRRFFGPVAEQVIGDLLVVTGSPVDTSAAVAAGARVVGVSDDPVVRTMLADAGATAVFDDLRDTAALIRAMSSDHADVRSVSPAVDRS